ncbi:30S ribosomal protein S16 [Buchnera aphidicola (Ceratovacuna keduensis)]|uniref:30S ribosomal protein S16 n=1 Tax=Buchnera aphidicola TaxID=9 RepID=UPI0031B84303
MIKIRLSRKGSKKKPFYKIIVSDVRFPQNGRFIEKIGHYNPINKNLKKNFYISEERTKFWLKRGAIFSKRVKSIIKKNKLCL